MPTITVVHALKVFHEEGVVFRGETRELRVVEYDKDMNRQGVEVVDWEDLLEWFEGRIDLEELQSRMQRLP